MILAVNNLWSSLHTSVIPIICSNQYFNCYFQCYKKYSISKIVWNLLFGICYSNSTNSSTIQSIVIIQLVWQSSSPCSRYEFVIWWYNECNTMVMYTQILKGHILTSYPEVLSQFRMGFDRALDWLMVGGRAGGILVY